MNGLSEDLRWSSACETSQLHRYNVSRLRGIILTRTAGQPAVAHPVMIVSSRPFRVEVSSRLPTTRKSHDIEIHAIVDSIGEIAVTMLLRE